MDDSWWFWILLMSLFPVLYGDSRSYRRCRRRRAKARAADGDAAS